MNKILVFDPSGNYIEGQGTSGWALYYKGSLTSVGQIRAADYNSRQGYWDEHIKLIEAHSPDIVVLEDYVLYGQSASAQIGSELETPQLIGIIKYYCLSNNIKGYIQHAKIKPRFSNEILLHRKTITQDNTKRYYAIGVPLTGHILDAIRHGEYFINFTLKKIQKEDKNGIKSF